MEWSQSLMTFQLFILDNNKNNTFSYISFHLPPANALTSILQIFLNLLHIRIFSRYCLR